MLKRALCLAFGLLLLVPQARADIGDAPDSSAAVKKIASYLVSVAGTDHTERYLKQIGVPSDLWANVPGWRQFPSVRKLDFIVRAAEAHRADTGQYVLARLSRALAQQHEPIPFDDQLSPFLKLHDLGEALHFSPPRTVAGVGVNIEHRRAIVALSSYLTDGSLNATWAINTVTQDINRTYELLATSDSVLHAVTRAVADSNEHVVNGRIKRLVALLSEQSLPARADPILRRYITPPPSPGMTGSDTLAESAAAQRFKGVEAMRKGRKPTDFNGWYWSDSITGTGGIVLGNRVTPLGSERPASIKFESTGEITIRDTRGISYALPGTSQDTFCGAIALASQGQAGVVSMKPFLGAVLLDLDTSGDFEMTVLNPALDNTVLGNMLLEADQSIDHLSEHIEYGSSRERAAIAAFLARARKQNFDRWVFADRPTNVALETGIVRVTAAGSPVLIDLSTMRDLPKTFTSQCVDGCRSKAQFVAHAAAIFSAVPALHVLNELAASYAIVRWLKRQRIELPSCTMRKAKTFEYYFNSPRAPSESGFRHETDVITESSCAPTQLPLAACRAFAACFFSSLPTKQNRSLLVTESTSCFRQRVCSGRAAKLCTPALTARIQTFYAGEANRLIDLASHAGKAASQPGTTMKLEE